MKNESKRNSPGKTAMLVTLNVTQKKVACNRVLTATR